MDDHDTSVALDICDFDTHGLGRQYPLRRHRYEHLSKAGFFEARQDWLQYVGPTDEFGCCNTINGDFASLVFPLTKPERLHLVAYFSECK